MGPTNMIHIVPSKQGSLLSILAALLLAVLSPRVLSCLTVEVTCAGDRVLYSLGKVP